MTFRSNDVILNDGCKQQKMNNCFAKQNQRSKCIFQGRQKVSNMLGYRLSRMDALTEKKKIPDENMFQNEVKKRVLWHVNKIISRGDNLPKMS